jgi:hypothetical protein
MWILRAKQLPKCQFSSTEQPSRAFTRTWLNQRVAAVKNHNQRGANIHMKRIILSIAASLVLVPTLSFAAQQTWTGEISDGMCGTNHQAMAKSGQKVNPRDCALECVKAGSKYVFASKGQVFEIANQEPPDLKKHAGHKVQVTGDLGSDGKTITVSKIQMAH